MLDNPVRKAIHTVASRSFPVVSARVIRNSLRFEYPGCQVADRITTENSCSFPRRNANGLIKIPHNFPVRTRSVMKVPTRLCHSGRHLRSPASEQFIGRKVMFKKFRLCARIWKRPRFVGILKLCESGYTRFHEGERLDEGTGLAWV